MQKKAFSYKIIYDIREENIIENYDTHIYIYKILFSNSNQKFIKMRYLFYNQIIKLYQLAYM